MKQVYSEYVMQAAMMNNTFRFKLKVASDLQTDFGTYEIICLYALSFYLKRIFLNFTEKLYAVNS